MENKSLYEVAITVIVVKDGKYLITRRSMQEKKWPGKWTVPGGKLEQSDYAGIPKDTPNAWYNIVEAVARKEVREEVGVEIENIRYVTSLVATYKPEDPHLLVLSMMADWKSGDVILLEEEADQYAWVTLEEAKGYDLIAGIYPELVMADKFLEGERGEWKKS